MSEMLPLPPAKEAALRAIWHNTPRDYKSVIGGKLYILTLQNGATCLVPLLSLSDSDIAEKLARIARRRASRL